MLIAHRSEDGRTQSFSEHATAVADLAARFAAKFGDERPARTGGLLHDAGKCSPAGQARLMGGGAVVDRSAARGNMACRKLVVFRHDAELGNAPAYRLFDTVKAVLKEGVPVPRSFSDYTFAVDGAIIPQGVSCKVMG